MISGIVPGEREVSFESHLSGALIGVLQAFVLRQRDPAPPRKAYGWEVEETEPGDYDRPDEPG